MRSLLFTVILSVFIGCDSGSDPKTDPLPIDSTDTSFYAYYPLEVGNYWIYSFFYHPTDTVKVRRVTDTVNIDGNKYYILVDSIRSFSNKLIIVDTTLLRHANDSSILERIGDSDRVYIDFKKNFTTSMYAFYPGVVFNYYGIDSSTQTRYYDCYEIIFRSVEPLTIMLSKNIGEVKRFASSIDAGEIIAGRINGVYYR